MSTGMTSLESFQHNSIMTYFSISCFDIASVGMSLVSVVYVIAERWPDCTILF